MKFIILLFIVFLFTSNLFSQNIAVFKFYNILENLEIYNDFTLKINNFKNKQFERLKLDESFLIQEKEKIEDKKLILSESEYLKLINDFNIKKNIFEEKVEKLNTYLQKNIEINENIIFNEIKKIVKNIAIEEKIDIILSDDQYFLSSDEYDISEKIYIKLNKSDISLELTKYE